MTLSMIISSGLLEFVLVVAVQSSHGRGRQVATKFFGILASVFISAGLFPQYWEIYKYREVIGISVLFMIVDLLGGVFSLLSLVFKDDFDVIAAVAYSAVVVSTFTTLDSMLSTTRLGVGRCDRSCCVDTQPDGTQATTEGGRGTCFRGDSTRSNCHPGSIRNTQYTESTEITNL